jgi:hypothetical protein
MSTDDHIDSLDAALNDPEGSTPEPEDNAPPAGDQTGADAVEPEADAAEDGSQDDGQDDGQDDNSQNQAGDKGTVPHGALHQEREQHKATREALAQRDTTIAQMNETFGKVMGQVGSPQQQPAAPAPIEVPDVSDDPVGHFQATQEQQQQQIDNLVGQQASPEEIQRQQQVQQMQSRAQAESNDAAQRDPEFWNRYSYAQQAIRHDLKLQGNTPDQVETIAQSWEENVMVNAVNSGKSYPDLITEYANGRGFETWRKGQGGQQQPGDKMRQLQAGANASGNLAGSGDASVGGKAKAGTLENLAGLSGTDFDKEFEKMKQGGKLG